MYLAPETKAEFEARAGKVGVESPHLSVRHRAGDLDISLMSGKEMVACAALSHFPGCCGIAILHNAYANGEHRDEILRLMFEVRERMATAGDKGLLVYTDVAGDEPGFLRKLGYTPGRSEFYNPNSGNQVKVWTKRVSQNG
jgi:hypothetical protein